MRTWGFNGHCFWFDGVASIVCHLHIILFAFSTTIIFVDLFLKFNIVADLNNFLSFFISLNLSLQFMIYIIMYIKILCKTLFGQFKVVEGLSLLPGSLPPSPADSGVSDVDSSSSGHTSTDELKARLQPSLHSPVGNFFSRHPLSWTSPAHPAQRTPSHMSQQFYQPFTSSKYYLFVS